MKIIKLTQGKETIVDVEDYRHLNKHKWFVDSSGYARRARKKIDGEGPPAVRMHRVIMNLDGSNLVVDHINGNKLDNRKQNLRICTYSQNSQNKKVKSNSISGYKGVTLCMGKYWMAYITHNKININLGMFDTKELAVQAYNEKAIEYHGEYARLNVLK